MKHDIGMVYVAWPCGQSVSSMFLHSIVGLLMSGERVHPSMVTSGPFLAQARNEIVTKFLGSGCEWLLQVDTDMSFSVEDYRTLLASGHPETRPIVGGLCVCTEPPRPVLAVGLADGDSYRWASRVGEIPADDDGVARVGWVGTAFLLTHRSVMAKIERPFDYRDGNVSEDVSFSLRAAEAGFPIHVNTRVRPQHWKSQALPFLE
jgi:hypothetical protein